MAANITKVLYGKQGRGRVGRSRSDIGVRLVYRYQNHISVLNMLIPPLFLVATDVATCNRGPILCKLDFGLGFAEEASTRRHHCKFRHRRTAGTCAGAARLALQPQQPRYLGEFAETAETPSIRLELPIPATTLQAAASTQFPPAAAIPAHSTIQCPPRGTHHIQAPSPLAQASVRSPFTLRKERTRKL